MGISAFVKEDQQHTDPRVRGTLRASLSGKEGCRKPVLGVWVRGGGSGLCWEREMGGGGGVRI